MKNSFLRVTTVVFAIWLGLAAGSANAVMSLSGWVGSNVTGYNTTFSNNAVINNVSGATFSDIFSFSVPADSSGNGAANAISLSGTDNVLFDSFELWEGGTMLSSGEANGTTSLLSFVNGAVPGNYELVVGGHKINQNISGSYAGNVSVFAGTTPISAVPEPEIYAMMLAGLGLLAFSARRRNNNV